MKRCSDRIYLASTLDPTPADLHRDKMLELRAQVAGYALALFVAAMLLVAVLTLMGCSKAALAAGAPDWNNDTMVVFYFPDGGQDTCYDWVAYPDYKPKGKLFWTRRMLDGQPYFCWYKTAEGVREEEEAERAFRNAADCYMGRASCRKDKP